MIEQDMVFGEYISEMLEEVINNRGFKVPLFFICISINGSMVYGRYDASRFSDELIVTTLCEHISEPEGAFVLPINFLLVDSCGEAARILLARGPDSKPRLRYFN